MTHFKLPFSEKTPRINGGHLHAKNLCPWYSNTNVYASFSTKITYKTYFFLINVSTCMCTCARKYVRQLKSLVTLYNLCPCYPVCAPVGTLGLQNACYIRYGGALIVMEVGYILLICSWMRLYMVFLRATLNWWFYLG